MAVKITYFVHGTTTDNEQDLATGWDPGELSAKGIQQSIQLPNLIKNKKFDIIFCSDLKRAIDTANLAFKNHKIIQDARLREANYRDYTKQPVAKFKSNLANFINIQFPNGESYKDVEKRISSFLKNLKKDYNNKHIAIVGHQAPQLALDVLLKDKSWQQAIAEDWRLTKSWQPGWEYEIK